MTITHALIVSLLALYRPPADVRARIDARLDAIERNATEAAERHGVPVALVVSVCFLETHLGTDRGEGGGCGSPVSRSRRHVAGTADHEARDLATSFRVCGSWLAAVRRYRTGLCDREPTVGYTAAYALHFAERVMLRAGVPLPDAWREARRRPEPLGPEP